MLLDVTYTGKIISNNINPPEKKVLDVLTFTAQNV